nr:16S rRNA (adenine(1518)-N(6)/adenine(1519)-N(6))-dimethyltransferase RsmA [Desulfuribacillus alkaliarsenatis]
MEDKQLYSKRVIREIMDNHGLHFKKSLGQNFLTDKNILDGIVDAAAIDKNSAVIEIGPGIGTLTQQLAKHAGKVIAVELDQRFIPVLTDNFRHLNHVSVIHGDALEIDFSKLISEQIFSNSNTQIVDNETAIKRIHVVANLPYYVTTPIIMRLLEERLNLFNIVVMIQKEVAERIQAIPGTKDYGALSIAAQYYAKPEIVSVVPRTVFIPEPNVDSAVIRLSLLEKPVVQVDKEEVFFKAIKAGFANRRKTLWNNFKAFDQRLSQDEMRAIFAAALVDEKRRGETLTIEEYARLGNEINRNLLNK